MEIEQLLKTLKLNQYNAYRYYVSALKYIKRNKLNKYDINLSSVILPYLSNRFKVSQVAISSAMYKDLRRLYNEIEETKELYNDLFGSPRRLTSLQFLIECTKYL